jgi:hypothetical protein
MAPVHGTKATLSVAGTALEGYVETTEMNLQRELAELRHLGGTAVGRLAGLRNCTFTAEGDYDSTIDSALYTAWSGAASVAVVFKPAGAGGATYSLSAWIESYTVRAAANAAVRFTINLSSDGTITKS